MNENSQAIKNKNDNNNENKYYIINRNRYGNLNND